MRNVWSCDFVADQTENGSSFRILTLLDEHTRRCLAIPGRAAQRAAVRPLRSLKRLVADQAVQIHILKEVNAKKW
jgi:hypothetical protein